MKFSMMGRDNTARVEEDAKFAQQHGFAAVEYNFWDGIESLTPQDIRFMKRVLSDHGIAVSMVGLWNRNYISTDPAEAQKALDLLGRAIDYAAELEARTITIGGGERHGATLDEQLDAFCAFYPPYLQRILQAKMVPAIYASHCTSFFKTPETYEQLWQRIPEPGVKFDAANWHEAGIDYLNVLDRLGPRIVHVHIKEFLRQNGRFIGEAAPGMGEMQWGKIMALLAYHAYDGYLAIEPHGPYRPGADNAAEERRAYVIGKRYMEQFVL